MSADRWAICPKCKRDAEKQRDDKKLKAGKSYGKVTPGEYLAALAESEKPTELGETFREDYWLGVNEDGFFSIDYSGSCGTCGLDHKFKYEKQLDIE